MILIPDIETAQIDPFTEVPTLTMICDVQDPITKSDYSRDPRYVARKAEAYLKKTGIADTAYFGPEAEFFVFDDVRFDAEPPRGLLPRRQHRRRLELRARRAARTLATSPGTRKATSRCPRTTRCRTSAARWS